MMAHAGLFFRSWLGSSNAKFAVDRHRIAVDDLPMETGCEFQRKNGLAAASGAENYNQQRIARHSARSPGDEVPGTRNGERKYQDDDHDQANSLQPLGAFGGLASFCTT